MKKSWDVGKVYQKDPKGSIQNERSLPLKEVHTTGETIVQRDPGGS